MKNLVKASLFGVAALGMGSTGSAQTTITQSAPTTVTSPIDGALQAFTVTLDAGTSLITGINITLTDNTGAPSVHNVQGFGDPGTTPTPFMDQTGALNTPERLAVDTHLLFLGDQLLNSAADATEATGGNSVTTPNEGATRHQLFVGGVALNSNNQGILAVAQKDPLPLLYVVLRPNETAVLAGQIAVAGEATPRTLTPFVVGVPEPTSLGLLAIGGLAMARRRRTIA
jgi:hypothetical protein